MIKNCRNFLIKATKILCKHIFKHGYLSHWSTCHRMTALIYIKLLCGKPVMAQYTQCIQLCLDLLAKNKTV